MELMTHSYETPLAPIGKNIATGLIIANIIFSGKKCSTPIKKCQNHAQQT